jgi:SprT protein
MRTIESPQEFVQLQRECIAQVKHYVDLANRKLKLSLLYPVIEFSLKGTTAGRAWWPANKIQFSPTLLRENPDTFLQQTVGHEVGHLAAHLRHRNERIDPHGDEWRNVMWTMGLPATRCHNYDTSNVPTRAGRTSRKIVLPSTGRLIDLD